jgi:8-oxo-dGTP pyrophosphatase MutT (NUDIX family)
VRRRILDFIDQHPHCLHRSCTIGHLTGSAVVVDPASGRTLLIHHAKLDRWLQPGGHADGEGDLGAVALREASEETGLDELTLVAPAVDLDVHHLPERGREAAHLHFDVRYLVLATGDLGARPNHETLGARWVAPDVPEVAGSDELSRAVAAAVRAAAEVAEGGSPGGAASGPGSDPAREAHR